MKIRSKITLFAFFAVLAAAWYGGANLLERGVGNAMLILVAFMAGLLAYSYPLSLEDEKEAQ